MKKSSVKRALRNVSIATLIAGVGLMTTGCRKAEASCGKGSCGSKSQTTETSKTSCGKGSCGQ